MQLLVLELRGSIAHFRRPDTAATQASYPFIPRTALRGLLAAVLGVEALPEPSWTGLQLLSPVRTVFQQMSMLGKGWLGSAAAFNRPTAIELVVEPSYRVYYAGPALEDLTALVSEKRSHYPTYLGSAYCLTVPDYRGLLEIDEVRPKRDEVIKTHTVVPVNAVGELKLYAGAHYSRSGTMHYRHCGERRFEGSINFLFEQNGGALLFRAKTDFTPPWQLCTLRGSQEVILLW